MMAQIPKRLHYVWIGNDEKPEIFHKCLKSWQEKLPDYEIVEIKAGLQAYEKGKGMPK